MGSAGRKSLSVELLGLSEKLLVKARDNKGSSGCIRERLLGPWPTPEVSKEKKLEELGLLSTLKNRMQVAISLMLDTRSNMGTVIEDLDMKDADLSVGEDTFKDPQ